MSKDMWMKSVHHRQCLGRCSHKRLGTKHLNNISQEKGTAISFGCKALRTFGKFNSPVTSDLNLNAVGIELSASFRVLQIRGIALVKADHFAANEIAAIVSVRITPRKKKINIQSGFEVFGNADIHVPKMGIDV